MSWPGCAVAWNLINTFSHTPASLKLNNTDTCKQRHGIEYCMLRPRYILPPLAPIGPMPLFAWSYPTENSLYSGRSTMHGDSKIEAMVFQYIPGNKWTTRATGTMSNKNRHRRRRQAQRIYPTNVLFRLLLNSIACVEVDIGVVCLIPCLLDGFRLIFKDGNSNLSEIEFILHIAKLR